MANPRYIPERTAPRSLLLATLGAQVATLVPFLFGLVTACAVLAGLAATGASGSTTAARATPAFPVTVTAGNGPSAPEVTPVS